MVKIIMRPRARSILAAHPAVHGTVSGCHPRLLVWVGEKAGRCSSPDDCAPDGTSAQLNTHNIKWLLLDSRVVDVPMAYNPTFVILSSPEALIFQSP
jgi:hypothetical protein